MKIEQLKQIEDIRGSTTFLAYDRDKPYLVLSLSHKNVLRGLHFQTKPWAHKKIFLLTGSIYDVMVDLKSSSISWEAAIIHAPAVIDCPSGYAHGYVTLSEKMSLIYNFTPYWDWDSTYTLAWNDPELNIPWNDYSDIDKLIISKRDMNGYSLEYIKQIIKGEK